MYNIHMFSEKKLSKLMGIRLSEVHELFKNPIINKNNILFLIDSATKNSKQLSKHIQELIFKLKIEMKKQQDEDKRIIFNNNTQRTLKDKNDTIKYQIEILKKLCDNKVTKLNSTNDNKIINNKLLPSDQKKIIMQNSYNLPPNHNIQNNNNKIYNKQQCTTKNNIKCEKIYDFPDKTKCEPACETKLFKKIKELLPCAPHIPISYVPFVACRPGTYCLTQNLISGSPGAAITVASSNVEINFNNFKLKLAGADLNINLVGVDIQNVEDVIIHGGHIDGISTNNNNIIGINIYNSKCIEIYDMVVTDVFQGIVGSLLSGVDIHDICFERPIPSIPVAPNPSVYIVGIKAINISNSKKINIRNITINEFTDGIDVPFCEEVRIEKIQGYKFIADAPVDPNGDHPNFVLSSGILADNTSKIMIEKVQLKNYFQGIKINNADDISIRKVQITYANPIENIFVQGIQIMSSIITSIKNVQILNYFQGISYQASGTLFIDNSQIYSDFAFNNTNNSGINIFLNMTTPSITTSIKNSQISNYFNGIFNALTTNVFIENSQIFLNFGSIPFDNLPAGIVIERSTVMSVKDSQICNYFQGIRGIISTNAVIENVQIFANDIIDPISLNLAIFAKEINNLQIINALINNYYAGIDCGFSNNITIQKSNIFISSANPAFNDSGNLAISVADSHKMNISDVEIRNYFTGIILGFEFGQVPQEAAEAIVNNISMAHDLQFRDTNNAGIRAFGMLLCNIKNAQIQNYYIGIDMFRAPNFLVKNAQIQNVQIHNDQIFTNPGITGRAQIGINAYASSCALIEDVTIDTVYQGINVSNGADIRINKALITNTIDGITSDGTWVLNAPSFVNRITIENSTLSLATHAAIDFVGVVSSEIKKSNISGNASGIRIINDVINNKISKAVNIKDNTITENTVVGILLGNETKYLCVHNNCIVENAIGIDMTGSTFNSIRENDIIGNNIAGLTYTTPTNLFGNNKFLGNGVPWTGFTTFPIPLVVDDGGNTVVP